IDSEPWIGRKSGIAGNVDWSREGCAAIAGSCVENVRGVGRRSVIGPDDIDVACRVGGNESAARKSQGLRYIRGCREIEAAVARTREEDIEIAGAIVRPNSVEVASGVDIELDASGISDAMGETGGT